jgi:hemerythrin superfamily protein
MMDRDPNAVPLNQTSSSSAYGGQASGLGGGSFVPGTEFGTASQGLGGQTSYGAQSSSYGGQASGYGGQAAGYGAAERAGGIGGGNFVPGTEFGTSQGATSGVVSTGSHGFSVDRVIPFLLQQHQQIKALFAEVISSSGQMRAEAWYRLRRLLAVHETAEEIVVHPSARKRIANGEQIIQQRLQEEGSAKQMLVHMESLDLDSAEFNTLLQQLQAAVLAHANSEETTEFNQLDLQLDDTEACRMKKAVEMAESMGPTRPHEGLGQSATGNILGGPFVSMIDRIRDAIECRHFRKEGQQTISHTD